jgi:salicylate hydroxylase
MPVFQAIVIGAGIAGLSTAIGLSRKGHRVLVLERSAELRTLGGGIQLRPNASRVLIEYGLKEMIEEEPELEPQVIYMRRYENAAVLAEIRSTDEERIYGAP